MTVKEHILLHLRTHSGWVSGTALESQSADWCSKASIISRRARELAYEGLIERGLSDLKTVQYREYMSTNMANDYLRSLDKIEKENQGVLL